MRAKKLVLITIFLSLFSLSAGAYAETISVAVAANVQYAFDELRAAFKQETGNDAVGTINSSGKFVAQISNGAPFDVFVSADMEFPEKLYKDGMTTAAPKVYAYGALVVWTTKNIDLTQWQAALTANQTTHIGVANPKAAPYGRETMKVFNALKLEQTLQPKLVFGESIAQTNQYIYSGAVDLGFTAKSVVLSPEMQGKGKWVDVPKTLYQPIAQGAVVLTYGRDHHAKTAQQFYDFLYSAKARAIFERYGYLLP